MDIENDIPINDDFDDNVQMDDDENSDEHHGENINENNDDNDLCQEFDGNLSEITNWTSLGVPTENHSNENSPPHFDFDADFGSGGLFQENDHNDKVNCNQLISQAIILVSVVSCWSKYFFFSLC